jgi:hypothetical protein
MSEAVANALKSGTEDVLKPAIHKTADAVGKAFHSVADGAEKVAGHAEETEAELSKGLKKYYLDDNGMVHELDGGGLHALDPKDGSGIHGLVGKDDKVTDPSDADMKNKYHARKDPENPGEAGVSSTKIKEPTPLSEAVEEARRANGDYGGRNYAAIKYRGEDGKEFILVGRSHNLRSHSERSLGKPLLGGKEANVKELYTERAPCQANENCERWLGRYFAKKNPGLEVTHGVDYDSSVPKVDRDWGHKAYVDQLAKDHASGGGPTMGTSDFDARGQQMKQAADAARAARASRTR